ncbi:MAG: hypothetical protein V4631_21125 [Pseudomonadota bacterium]
MRARQSRYNPEKREQQQNRKREQSYRATVLAVIVASTTWRAARDIAHDAKLTYPQTIFALFALHNNAQIARTGHKFTARWGPLGLDVKPDNNFQLLERLFNGTIKR